MITIINSQITSKFGNYPSGGYSDFEYDGSLILHGDATVWDDLRFQAFGQNLDIVAGRIDYNFTYCTVGFEIGARYPNEPLCILAQMPHSRKLGSVLKPHIHWVQSEINIPNWLIEYRWISNGGTIPLTTLKKYVSNSYAYSGSTIIQRTIFPDIIDTGFNISSLLTIRIFRDSANTSTLFTGLDPYTVTAELAEFDIHYEMDSLGSRTEHTK